MTLKKWKDEERPKQEFQVTESHLSPMPNMYVMTE